MPRCRQCGGAHIPSAQRVQQSRLESSACTLPSGIDVFGRFDATYNSVKAWLNAARLYHVLDVQLMVREEDAGRAALVLKEYSDAPPAKNELD